LLSRLGGGKKGGEKGERENKGGGAFPRTLAVNAKYFPVAFTASIRDQKGKGDDILTVRCPRKKKWPWGTPRELTQKKKSKKEIDESDNNLLGELNREKAGFASTSCKKGPSLRSA